MLRESFVEFSSAGEKPITPKDSKLVAPPIYLCCKCTNQSDDDGNLLSMKGLSKIPNNKGGNSFILCWRRQLKDPEIRVMEVEFDGVCS